MIELDIPGRGNIQLFHLVLDVNGTIAKDGQLLDRLARSLVGLKDRLDLHLVTADTYGRQAAIDLALAVRAVRLEREGQAEQKAALVRSLGAHTVVAMGNGANDALMLAEAAIGIAVLGDEGLAVAAMQAADILVRDIYDGLDLIERPTRLVATLRR
jgi:soluble P-type ATPase